MNKTTSFKKGKAKKGKGADRIDTQEKPKVAPLRIRLGYLGATLGTREAQ